MDIFPQIGLVFQSLPSSVDQATSDDLMSFIESIADGRNR
jgi:hypothetical protein